MSDVKSPREKWPDTGGDFNSWYRDLPRFVACLDRVRDVHWWGVDSDLKYLQIRVDTRNNNFLLFCRESQPISPDRVLDAIEKYMTRFGKREANP